jgi:hypothetical protein
MSAEDLQELLNKQPFEPFRIKLSNGDAHEIRDPNLVVVMKTKVFIAFPNDRFTLCSLLHVTSVESLQAA